MEAVDETLEPATAPPRVSPQPGIQVNIEQRPLSPEIQEAAPLAEPQHAPPEAQAIPPEQPPPPSGEATSPPIGPPPPAEPPLPDFYAPMTRRDVSALQREAIFADVPHPYPPLWELEGLLAEKTSEVYHNREDTWMWQIDGEVVENVRDRVFGMVVAGVWAKQGRAHVQWLEERAWARAREEAEAEAGGNEGGSAGDDGVDRRFDVRFAMVDGTEGVAMASLLSGRRVLGRVLRSPKDKVFEDYGKESVRVRIQWPAYPDHTPIHTILTTIASGRKRRRLCSRLEFAVTLTSAITQYYAEVSAMEPHPAFAHLALGPSEGRLSLYALRMKGIRAVSQGLYDLELELDGTQPGPSAPSAAASRAAMNAGQSSAPADVARPSAGGPFGLNTAPTIPEFIAADSGTLTTTSGPPPATRAHLLALQSTNTTHDSGSAHDPPPGPQSEPDDGRAKTPPWASTLPVTCTVASPPKIPCHQYFSHVGVKEGRPHPLPVWPDLPAPPGP